MLKLCRDVFLVSVFGARDRRQGLRSEEPSVPGPGRGQPAEGMSRRAAAAAASADMIRRGMRATRGARIPRRGACDRGHSLTAATAALVMHPRSSARAPASQMGSRRTSQTSCRAGTRSSPPCSGSPAVVSAVPPAAHSLRARLRLRRRRRRGGAARGFAGAPLAVVGGVACAFAGAEFAEPAATLGVGVGRVLASGSAAAADVVAFRSARRTTPTSLF